MDVFYAVGRLVGIARFSLAVALIGCIESQADIALLCHSLAVEPCHLFLDATVGVSYDNGRIVFGRIITGWSVDVVCYLQAIQLVIDAVDVYLAIFVFRESVCIDQSEGIVVGTLYGIEIYLCKNFCLFLFHHIFFSMNGAAYE